MLHRNTLLNNTYILLYSFFVLSFKIHVATIKASHVIVAYTTRKFLSPAHKMSYII